MIRFAIRFLAGGGTMPKLPKVWKKALMLGDMPHSRTRDMKLECRGVSCDGALADTEFDSLTICIPP